MPATEVAAVPRLRLDTSVQYVRGIGPRRAEELALHGIRTVGDLVDYPPFRYEDRTEQRPVASAREGEWTLVEGRIGGIGGSVPRRGGLDIFEMLVKDSSGAIRVKFFNQPYLRNIYKSGMRVILYGQVRRDEYGGHQLIFTNPECEIVEGEDQESLHSGRVVPVYRKLGSLRSRALRRILFEVVNRLPPDMPDPIPAFLRDKYRLLPRARALAEIHFPSLRNPAGRQQEIEALNRGLSPAHKRLIFEELFLVQVGIQWVRRGRISRRKERTVRLGAEVREAIKKVLPFHPTGAQKRTLKEIASEMSSPRPMSRLLQGDVGSGKTIVAAQAAIIAVENGFQAAIMAPTEILAEQHYFSFRRLLAPLGYRVGLLKGSLSARARREALEGIRSGETRVIIGTHALIQEGVEFKALGLVVIDEQHRFGVLQRSTLQAKGNAPDVLVMTATPIPRSLALTLYGDLDVSVIDEMPPGRRPVVTISVNEKQRGKVDQAIRQTVARGQQVYIVCPLVAESEKSDLTAATELAEHLRSEVFPSFSIGLLHGKMKSTEKDAAMTRFAAGELDILVATTVVEVGVDVANATLMVIEHAERFGLAQLHQLRGRVGRGPAESRCILIANVAHNPEAQNRIETLCRTHDGFRIAETDLEMRGPGEVAGTRQSGMPVFKYANVVRDRKALELARVEAARFVSRLDRRPDMEDARIASWIRQQWQERFGLALVG